MAQELNEYKVYVVIEFYKETHEFSEIEGVFKSREEAEGLTTDYNAKYFKYSYEIFEETLKLGSVELGEYRVYDDDEVDAVLTEKDAEIRRLKRALWLSRAGEAAKEVNYWTCKNESSYAIVDFNVHHETIVSYKAPHHRPYKWILIWENVEHKCRAKAEEYR